MLVLVVVLAVMAGFEREVKKRLLGFSPHATVYFMPDGEPRVINDWEEMVERLEKVEGVEEAYAQMRDFTLLEYGREIVPVEFHAIDTTNESQMEALEELIDKEKYGGTAQMGLGEKVVVSEPFAKRLGLVVGDLVQLYSARNLNELSRTYQLTDRDPAAVEFADEISAIIGDLRTIMTVAGGKESFKFEELKGVYERILDIYHAEIRPGERELIAQITEVLNSGEKDETEALRLLEAGSVSKVEALFGELGELDMEKEDARVLKDLREVVLPKDLEVIGIFKASDRVLHPSLFVPLPTGQELKGLEGGVEAIGVRVVDPYKVEDPAAGLVQVLSPNWRVITWKQQNEAFVKLIATERAMMYFALSFIILVAAFCMMAVMFTVTIQKKQEIGVMKALGAIPSQIVSVFLYQGMIIGFFGSLLGVGLGLLVIRFREPIHNFFKSIGFDFFPSDFQNMDKLPAHVNPVEVVAIAGGAFILCSLGAYIPARLASRRDAARSLRNF